MRRCKIKLLKNGQEVSSYIASLIPRMNPEIWDLSSCEEPFGQTEACYIKEITNSGSNAFSLMCRLNDDHLDFNVLGIPDYDIAMFDGQGITVHSIFEVHPEGQKWFTLDRMMSVTDLLIEKFGVQFDAADAVDDTIPAHDLDPVDNREDAFLEVGHFVLAREGGNFHISICATPSSSCPRGFYKTSSGDVVYVVPWNGGYGCTCLPVYEALLTASATDTITTEELNQKIDVLQDELDRKTDDLLNAV